MRCRYRPAAKSSAVTPAAAAIQRKLNVGETNDPLEREADSMADKVMRMPESPLVQRRSASSSGDFDDEHIRFKPLSGQAIPFTQAKSTGVQTASDNVSSRIKSTMGGGSRMDAGIRSFMESRFGADFSRVNIHTGREAIQLNRELNAQAFTVGNDIYFNSNKYNPQSNTGKQLLAHELTHTVQQGNGIKRKQQGGLTTEPEEGNMIGGIIQRDLAVEPPNPMTASVVLTADQMQEAIKWNQHRFRDPYNIMNVRDIVGIPKYPAVIDEEFVNAVIGWQAGFGITQDGKFGADATGKVATELKAEGKTTDAETLSLDNPVDTFDDIPQAYNACALHHPPFEFNWQVHFRTTMRNGFIIQRIDNTFNATMCDGTAYTGALPTARYWEAWHVDGNGNVIPVVGGVNDMFIRTLRRGSRGNWVMRGTLHTTRTLPAAFVAGAVPDAGILRSTVAAPNSDFLGYVANTRRVGGTWNCCGVPPTHVRS